MAPDSDSFYKFLDVDSNPDDFYKFRSTGAFKDGKEWALKARIPLADNGPLLSSSLVTVGLIALASGILLPLLVLVLSRSIVIALIVFIVIFLAFALALGYGLFFVLGTQFSEGGLRADAFINDLGLVCDIYNDYGMWSYDRKDRSSLTWGDMDVVTIDRGRNTIEVQSRALKERRINLFCEPEEINEILDLIKKHIPERVRGA